MSGDGRLVAFTTGSPDLAAGGPGAGADVFGRNRGVPPGGTATRLSAPAGGPALGPAVTEFPCPLRATGSVVAYASAAPGPRHRRQSTSMTDVFVSDRAKAQTIRVSLGLNGAQPDGPSGDRLAAGPVGRRPDRRLLLVRPPNLVADDTNTAGDVFVFDRAKKETTRVSVVGPTACRARAATATRRRCPPTAGTWPSPPTPPTSSWPATPTAPPTCSSTTARRSRRPGSASGPGGVQSDQLSYSPSISGDGSVRGLRVGAATSSRAAPTTFPTSLSGT